MGKNNKKNAHKEKSEQGKSPGKLLESKRKSADIDEKQAANALKITVSRLKALEGDDFSYFPSETYARGYLRNYCRFLKIDEKDVLDAYELLNPTIEAFTQDDEPNHVALYSNKHKQWWIVYVVLVLIALIWILSYWLMSGTVEDPIPESQLTQEETVEQLSSAPDSESKLKLPSVNLPVELTTAETTLIKSTSSESEDKALENISITEGVESAVEGAIDNVESKSNTVLPMQPDPQIVVSTVTAADLVKKIMSSEEKAKSELDTATIVLGEVVENVADGDTLRFDFDNPCWIKVTDVTGNVIFSGLQKPGTQVSVRGKAPFRIVVGNVEGTSLVYNGEPVQLNARSDGRALRLQVGG